MADAYGGFIKMAAGMTVATTILRICQSFHREGFGRENAAGLALQRGRVGSDFERAERFRVSIDPELKLHQVAVGLRHLVAKFLILLPDGFQLIDERGKELPLAFIRTGFGLSHGGRNGRRRDRSGGNGGCDRCGSGHDGWFDRSRFGGARSGQFSGKGDQLPDRPPMRGSSPEHAGKRDGTNDRDDGSFHRFLTGC